jgi:hypothetical protein
VRANKASSSGNKNFSLMIHLLKISINPLFLSNGRKRAPRFSAVCPKKVSKAYVFKIFLYTIVLVAMGIFLYRKLKQQDKTKVNSPEIEQIDHVKIDSPDQ